MQVVGEELGGQKKEAAGAARASCLGGGALCQNLVDQARSALCLAHQVLDSGRGPQAGGTCADRFGRLPRDAKCPDYPDAKCHADGLGTGTELMQKVHRLCKGSPPLQKVQRPCKGSPPLQKVQRLFKGSTPSQSFTSSAKGSTPPQRFIASAKRSPPLHEIQRPAKVHRLCKKFNAPAKVHRLCKRFTTFAQ
eukprot:230713-Chlamydomonas_euryale.AAC.1